MPRWRIEQAIGDVDGVNTAFQTPSDYRPGTLSPILNGLACAPGAVTESPPNGFTLAVAPKSSDNVSVMYQPVVF